MTIFRKLYEVFYFNNFFSLFSFYIDIDNNNNRNECKSKQ